MTAVRVLLAALAAWAIAQPATANIDRSPRPEARPAGPATAPAQSTASTRAYVVRVGFNADIRPRPRPWTNAAAVAAPIKEVAASAAPVPQVKASRLAVARSPRPEPRGNQRVRVKPQRVAMSVTRKPTTVSKEGKICKDRAIRGRKVSPIAGRMRGCGVQNPVQVTEVAGVRLSTASTMNCETAQALKSWIENGLKPAVRRKGGGVAELKVAAHYSCRTRNNRPGAKISEHGKGNAIDISAIRLNNGVEISVLRDWNKRAEGKVLKAAHKSACGPFKTVLGPNADRYHRDHFHFDIARHRGGGKYCR